MLHQTCFTESPVRGSHSYRMRLRNKCPGFPEGYHRVSEKHRPKWADISLEDIGNTLQTVAQLECWGPDDKLSPGPYNYLQSF